MPKFIGTIKDSFRHFMLNILEMTSTRIQLIYLTFFCWMFGIFYFATMVPVVREISIIYYRQNSIQAKPVDIDSVYGSTILTMLGTAFMATVGGYIVSKQYENKLNNNDVNNNDTERVGKVTQSKTPLEVKENPPVGD